MKRDDNPQTLFKQIANIKNQYLDPKANIKLEEEDLIAQVIAPVPRAYQAVLTAEQLGLGANIMMKDISKAMTAQWRTTHGGEDNDDNEFSLITYFIYKQEGHKAHQCPNKKKKRFPGRCNHCHQLGHKANDCWEKEENKAKRPPNWKSKMHTETANAAITRTNQDTGSNIEFLSPYALPK